jgi:hypothetical protein
LYQISKITKKTRKNIFNFKQLENADKFKTAYILHLYLLHFFLGVIDRINSITGQNGSAICRNCKNNAETNQWVVPN